jgi:hypothetical protein
MARDEDPRPREDTILDSFFDRKLGTTAITNTGEASMKHLSRCVRLPKQVDIIWVSECL